jgi:hypothetical protein
MRVKATHLKMKKRGENGVPGRVGLFPTRLRFLDIPIFLDIGGGEVGRVEGQVSEYLAKSPKSPCGHDNCQNHADDGLIQASFLEFF